MIIGLVCMDTCGFSVVRQHCILYKYIYLCLYAYRKISFVCSTSMCLMYNTLNTMQHTASGEWHLVGNTLQHAATHCDTLQHTATHYNTHKHVSCTREHLIGNTLQHTASHFLVAPHLVNVHTRPRFQNCRALWQ